MTNFHYVYVYLVTFIKVYTNSLFAHFEHQLDQCGFEWPRTYQHGRQSLEKCSPSPTLSPEQTYWSTMWACDVTKRSLQYDIYFVMKGRTLQKLQLKEWWNCVMKYLKEIVISFFFILRCFGYFRVDSHF